MRYWKRVDETGVATTVESYSHNLEVKGAIEIDKVEFDNFIASLPEPELIPVRDIFAEIGILKARIEKLETR